jgi:hypothetical protein
MLCWLNDGINTGPNQQHAPFIGDSRKGDGIDMHSSVLPISTTMISASLETVSTLLSCLQVLYNID